MSRAVRPVRMMIDEEKAEILKAELFMYRLDSLSHNRNMLPVSIPESISSSGRIVEIINPLIEVAPIGIKWRFIELCSTLQRERITEESLSLESRIFNALSYLHKDYEMFIPLQSVADLVNANLPEREGLSNKTIGTIISKLGFKKQLYKSVTHVVWSEDVFKRLSRRYPLIQLETEPKQEEIAKWPYNSHPNVSEG
jgi:hypothetical protein